MKEKFRQYRNSAFIHARTWSNIRSFLTSQEITIKGLRVLDIGCGKLSPLTLLFKSHGAEVTGIDLLYIKPPPLKMLPPISLSNIKQNCIKLCYYDTLAYLTRTRWSATPIQTVVQDAGKLSFTSDNFDLVVSFAAIEHFLDVSQVASEIHRILRPGGFVYLVVHLWTSLTGGHEEFYWRGGIPKNITNPWAHLRDPNWHTDIPLNRWRQQDYVDEFSKFFNFVTSGVESQIGSNLLTEERLAMLPDYSPREMVDELVILVFQKPETGKEVT